MGAYAATVVTAVVAKNSRSATDVLAMTAPVVAGQLKAVLDDLPVAAVKTGMLATEAVVLAVAAMAAAGRLPNLVVDPVLVSSTGARLLDAGAESAYLDALLPRALVATPNTREATALLGEPVETVADARDAARRIAERGPRWVVVKGGHLTGEGVGDDAVDVVHDRESGETSELRLPRVATRNDHGTGCTFAAATTALLARGAPVPEALAAAKRFVHDGLVASAGWTLGGGRGPVGKLASWSEAVEETPAD
jgi:hydroxymethylpyrimidine/phosphomethylpyrimidine kinase